MLNNKAQPREIQKVVQTGLLLSIALVIRSLSYTLYIAGVPAIRIGFAGCFTRLAGVLFGPVYGGIASGITDFLGYLMKPEGGYIPWLTLTAIGGGVLSALLWKWIKNIPRQQLQRILLILFTSLTLLGIANRVMALSKYEFTWIPVVGLIFLAIDFYLSKKRNLQQGQIYFLKLLISLAISGIAVTTVNTYVLKLFIPALADKGFMILWIPRLIQELIITPIKAYVMTILLYIYEKFLVK